MKKSYLLVIMLLLVLVGCSTNEGINALEKQILQELVNKSPNFKYEITQIDYTPVLGASKIEYFLDTDNLDLKGGFGNFKTVDEFSAIVDSMNLYLERKAAEYDALTEQLNSEAYQSMSEVEKEALQVAYKNVTKQKENFQLYHEAYSANLDSLKYYENRSEEIIGYSIKLKYAIIFENGNKVSDTGTGSVSLDKAKLLSLKTKFESVGFVPELLNVSKN